MSAEFGTWKAESKKNCRSEIQASSSVFVSATTTNCFSVSARSRARMYAFADVDVRPDREIILDPETTSRFSCSKAGAMHKTASQRRIQRGAFAEAVLIVSHRA